jgi:hypothetical protein
MTYDSEVLADSPWGYWKTNEASGNLLDSSGNSRTLTRPGGDPTYAQTGPSGAADAQAWPDSSGATEYYAVSSASPGSGTAFSLECWFYLTATPTNPVGLISIAYGYGNNSKRPLHLYIDTDGKVKLAGGSSSSANWSPVVSSSSAVSLNTWHHVVAKTAASAQTIRLDKVQVATGTFTTSVTTSDFVFVHGGGDQILSSLINCSAVTIAKPALYLSTLSDARIDAHYDAMVSGDNSVSGVAATATAAAVVPVVSAASGVSGVAATATATAAAPTVTASATVTAPAATATATALTPAVTATSTVVTPAATATADAIAPVITIPGDQTVIAPAATATADAIAPTFTVDSTVAGSAAAAIADALVPTITATSSATVAAVTATATATAIAPAVFAGSPDATVNAVVATATAVAFAPLVLVVLPVGTDTTNGENGLEMVGAATVTVTRSVAAPPPTVTLAKRYDKAIAYPNPVIVNGRPT